MDKENDSSSGNSQLAILAQLQPALYFKILKQLGIKNPGYLTAEDENELKHAVQVAVIVQHINKIINDASLEKIRRIKAFLAARRVEKKQKDEDILNRRGGPPIEEIDAGVKEILEQMDKDIERLNKNLQELYQVRAALEQWPIESTKKEAALFHDQAVRLAQHLQDMVKNGQVKDPALIEQIEDYQEQIKESPRRQENLEKVLVQHGAAVEIPVEGKVIKNKLLSEIRLVNVETIYEKVAKSIANNEIKQEGAVSKLKHLVFEEQMDLGKEFKQERIQLKQLLIDEKLNLENDLNRLEKIIEKDQAQILDDIVQLEAKGISIDKVIELPSEIKRDKISEPGSDEKEMKVRQETFEEIKEHEQKDNINPRQESSSENTDQVEKKEIFKSEADPQESPEPPDDSERPSF